jgi:RNA polymerase sigma factor (sigma-70 family)
LEPLPYLKESRLIQAAQEGDIAARNEVWMHYARLVLSVVNSFRIPESMLADAIQEGAIGLHKAIKKFEIERYNSFSTYAWPWVYQYVQRFLVSNLFSPRIPSYLFRDYMRFQRELRCCIEPGDEAALFSKWRNINRKLYKRIIQIHNANNAMPLQFLGAASHPEVFDRNEQDEVDRKAICHEAIRSLENRDQKIINMRYGMSGEPEMTLKRVGQELGLTRERIRQLQVQAEALLETRLHRI